MNAKSFITLVFIATPASLSLVAMDAAKEAQDPNPGTAGRPSSPVAGSLYPKEQKNPDNRAAAKRTTSENSLEEGLPAKRYK
jgi:hypothetical protein